MWIPAMIQEEEVGQTMGEKPAAKRHARSICLPNVLLLGWLQLGTRLQRDVTDAPWASCLPNPRSLHMGPNLFSRSVVMGSRFFQEGSG